MYRTAEEVAERIRPVLDQYEIEKGILFGSYALGTQTARSDVDLILIQRTSKRFLDRYEGILRDLYQVLRGVDIEVLIYTPEEMEAIRHRKFIERALNEGRVIYEPR